MIMASKSFPFELFDFDKMGTCLTLELYVCNNSDIHICDYMVLKSFHDLRNNKWYIFCYLLLGIDFSFLFEMTPIPKCNIHMKQHPDKTMGTIIYFIEGTSPSRHKMEALHLGSRCLKLEHFLVEIALQFIQRNIPLRYHLLKEVNIN